MNTETILRRLGFIVFAGLLIYGFMLLWDYIEGMRSPKKTVAPAAVESGQSEEKAIENMDLPEDVKKIRDSTRSVNPNLQPKGAVLTNTQAEQAAQKSQTDSPDPNTYTNKDLQKYHRGVFSGDSEKKKE